MTRPTLSQIRSLADAPRGTPDALGACFRCRRGWHNPDGTVGCGAPAEDEQHSSPVWAERKYSFEGLSYAIDHGKTAPGGDCDHMEPDDGYSCRMYERRDPLEVMQTSDAYRTEGAAVCTAVIRVGARWAGWMRDKDVDHLQELSHQQGIIIRFPTESTKIGEFTWQVQFPGIPPYESAAKRLAPDWTLGFESGPQDVLVTYQSYTPPIRDLNCNVSI